jgi:putative endonuclease
MNQRGETGQYGEGIVSHYLQERHFTILARNFRNREGEVDLIAQKDSLIIFVEVKTRTNPRIDSTEIITKAKQRKIARTAALFMAQQIVDVCDCRFDVALVSLDAAEPTITYIPNAFQADEYA